MDVFGGNAIMECNCLEKIDKAIEDFRHNHDWEASNMRAIEGRIVDILELIIIEAMKDKT